MAYNKNNRNNNDDRDDKSDFRKRSLSQEEGMCFALTKQEKAAIIKCKHAWQVCFRKGKILPRRITSCCAAHQRVLTTAVKRARHIAIMPYTVD